MTSTKEEFWYKLSWFCEFNHKEIFSLYKHAKDKKLNIEDIFNLTQIDDQGYAELKDKEIQILFYDHELYPESLIKLMKDHPPILFCKGNLNLLKSDGVAIIGSRNASQEGLKFANEIARKLAEKGINIISGYAKGIDTSAHLGALENNGTTTIVLSSGILNFSETKIKESFKKDKTLIISQFNPKSPWSAQNAMIRNELVCALSKIVIVIESGPEKTEKDGKKHLSGTYDAAKKALKMGIPLFVLDPSTFQIPPIGNTKLIEKEKATKIKPDESGIEEILKLIKPTQKTKEIQPNFFTQPEK